MDSGGFRPLTAITARWCQDDGPSVEHLTLEQHGGRITATAVVTSPGGERPYAAWYHIFLDGNWQVKAVSVHRTDSRWFVAQSPQPGRWCDGDGGAIGKLDGCRDVALLMTRFTVTPLIRRLNLAKGDARKLDVLALPLVTMAPTRLRQRITCLEPASHYRIEDLNDNTKQDVRVDGDGLICQKAGKFNRVI